MVFHVYRHDFGRYVSGEREVAAGDTITVPAVMDDGVLVYVDWVVPETLNEENRYATCDGRVVLYAEE